jgi:hypothetical protein
MSDGRFSTRMRMMNLGMSEKSIHLIHQLTRISGTSGQFGLLEVDRDGQV